MPSAPTTTKAQSDDSPLTWNADESAPRWNPDDSRLAWTPPAVIDHKE